MASRSPNRSERLLRVLSDYDPLIVVTHDNPDPDAIAAGWALLTLIESRLERSVRLVGGGAIVRAENREMIRLLEPPLELVQEPDWEPGAAAILVDCGPEASHHLLNGRDVQPVAVIDHHLGGRRLNLPFADLRPKTAASATIAASYLKEQALIPGERLATALVYGIRTETSGSETHYSRLDRSMLAWLSRYANPSWLAEIENAPLSREYYNDLVLALQNTFLYDDAALCVLPRAEGPETVGEVADLLIRGEGIRRVLCAAAYNGDILVSVRTEEESDSAAELVRRTLKGLGHGGGHAHRAGGKIPGAAAEKISEAMEDELRDRWLAACQVDRQRGTRLVARREILENL